ncbi:hypothetical protein [Pseudonocardia alni]|uniref:hypothetical protein n=1 Tax=Pseudonocardia alni TaxID=33907 RepID=UPI0033301C42
MASVDIATSPWFASANLTADEMRLAMAALTEVGAGQSTGSETGVFPSTTGLRVTTASSTSVSVAAGACAIQTPVGGTYIATIPSTTTVGVTSQSTNSRIDLVCVRVLDSEAGDGSGQTLRTRLLTVEGTAAASPSIPSTPAGYLVLAQLLVNSSGITTTDRRVYTRAAGGVRLATSQDTRAGSYPGDVRNWASGQIDVWTGSAWITVVSPVVWTQTTASLYGTGTNGNGAGEFGLGTNGSKIMRYKRTGNDLTISYAFRWGTAPFSTPAGNVVTYLPNNWVTPAGRDQWIPCQIWVNDSVSGVVLDFAGMALIQASSNVVRPYYPRSNGSGGFATGIRPYLAANGSGPGVGIPYIAGGYPTGGTVHIGPATIELAA